MATQFTASTRARIREVLDRYIDDVDIIKQLVEQVGWQRTRFPWNKPAEVIWWEVVTEACKEPAKLRRLVEVAAERHPDQPALRELVRLVEGEADGDDLADAPLRPAVAAGRMRVLLLSAIAVDQSRARVDQEFRDIEVLKQSATQRDRFDVRTVPAARLDDWRRMLLQYRPEVVHFAGHGNGPHGLELLDEMGDAQDVTGEVLAALLRLHRDHVRCVVLNACHSVEQARAIREHIPVVIGMSDRFEDSAALQFAQGFYRALFEGSGYERAFGHGRAAVRAGCPPMGDIPTLL